MAPKSKSLNSRTPAASSTSVKESAPAPANPSASSTPRTVSGIGSTTTNMSFADLIRAREAQQQKAREELEAQNRQLRERLGLLTESLSHSPERDDPVAGEDWESPRPAAASATSHPLDDAEGVSPGGLTRQRSMASMGKQQLLEVITYVTEMKDTLRRSQEADAVALQQLSEKFEWQSRQYEDRISVLEARLAAEERARDILREEQNEQFEMLSNGMEELRSSGAMQLQERCRVLEEALSNHSLSIQTLNLNAESADERMTETEAMLEASKSHALATQQSVTTLEVELARLAEGVERDRSTILALKDETLIEQQQRLDNILRSAAQQLEFSEKQLTRLQQLSASIEQDLETTMLQHIQDAEQRLESHTQSKWSDLEAALATERSAIRNALDSARYDVSTALSDASTTLESSLQGMRMRYATAVDAQIGEVVQRAKDLEDQRRAEFPVADVDRVNLMVAELEGAATLLEGIAKNTALPHGSGRQCPLTQRLEKLELLVDEIDAKTRGELCPRIMFSVDTQAGPLSTDFGPFHSQSEKTKRHVERHLQHELERVAADTSAVRARTETAVAIVRASSPSPRSVTSSQLSPRVGYPATTASGRGALGDRHMSPSPTASTHTSVPPSALSAAHRRERLAQLADEKQRKEAAAEKVQHILREIQSRFQELSIREPLQRSMHSNAASPTTQQRRLSEMIAKQKEAVFQKERMLVEQRNRLWREIADIEQEEDTLQESL